MSAADLSVIIVTHNSNQYLPPCLRSIPSAAGGLSYEVIVADNGSKTLEMLPVEFPGVRWMGSPENLGWGRAVNLAVAASRGEIVVLLNPDTELTSGALAEIVRFFSEKNHESLGPVGGKLLFSSGETQPSCGPFPHLANLIMRLPLRPPQRRYYWRMSEQPARVDWVTGAFMAVRRSVFDRLGGMDSGFFLYYEDVDFCLRARQQGWASYYLPQAAAYHHNPHAVRPTRSPQLARIIQDSRSLYFKKHRPAWESWVLSQLHKLEKVS